MVIERAFFEILLSTTIQKIVAFGFLKNIVTRVDLYFEEIYQALKTCFHLES